jgi:hypothetical protein
MVPGSHGAGNDSSGTLAVSDALNGSHNSNATQAFHAAGNNTSDTFALGDAFSMLDFHTPDATSASFTRRMRMFCLL